MLKPRVGAQLYTLRDYLKTPPEITATLRKVKAIGYEAVQLSALGPIDRKALKEILAGEGIIVAATHTDYEKMRTDLEAVIDEHHYLGCQHTAVGALPREYRNATGYQRFAKEASEVAHQLAEGGITFSYHNHSFEFERYGDKTGLQILLEESDPAVFNFEIDTYWVQHGGGDPAEWIRKVSDRIPLVHFKDMTIVDRSQFMAEVGEGNLNWPAILNACQKAGVTWYLVEQDHCQRDPFESLAISLKNLKQMGIT